MKSIPVITRVELQFYKSLKTVEKNKTVLGLQIKDFLKNPKISSFRQLVETIKSYDDFTLRLILGEKCYEKFTELCRRSQLVG